jgi:hypothetical protein
MVVAMQAIAAFGLQQEQQPRKKPIKAHSRESRIVAERCFPSAPRSAHSIPDA